nr:transposase, MuDR, MULE transposase domain protein [Tanacetum cinerariifolium]
MINDGTVTHIEKDTEDRFKMVFIAFGVVIQSFKNHMKPLIAIDASYLKGTYLRTNLQVVRMDGNNQIILIATGGSQGETGPSWTWLQCLFWKMCKTYSPEDFNMAINELGAKRPDVYQKFTKAGVEKWSRAHCPSDRYNYMTSNSAESINSLTRDVQKISITNLMDWYRDLVQRWYCER